MYADDILLYKPISHPGDYSGVQTDVDAIQDCISTNYLTLNPQKCQYTSFVQERDTLIYLQQDSTGCMV